MKHSLLILSIILHFNFSYSQINQSVLDASTTSETILTFNFNQYELKSVRTPKGNEKIVVAKNTTAIMEKGAPDVPKFTESIIIPDLENMKVEIMYTQYTDIPNVIIAPSKGNFSRTILPKDVPYEYGKYYSEDVFFPKQLAQLNSPYIMRDYRGQALQVNPFQYNPVSKILRVYSEIKLRVYSDGQIGQNILERTKPLTKIDNDFAKIYSNHFKNFSSLNPNYTPLDEEGKMLIICNDAWINQMTSFVNWKNSIGRPTELISVSNAGGTATAIKNYVTTYYNTKGLTYLLLVGDAEQVPTNSQGTVSGIQIGGDSDNAYAYISGIDHYQEFFVGRFSAENTDQVNTQVQRTIEYEKGDQLAEGWLNKIISIASDQGPGDDNELDYEHLRNIQPDLLGFTYQNPVSEFFDGSQGNFDANGNPSPSSVANALNNGAGILNYVGHGSDLTWGTSGFSNNDVSNLINHNKLPFIFDVACVNGNFVGQTTFAESWMRAQNNNEPTGSIAICASTINQSWSPPMVAQDEMNDIIVGTATTGLKRTFGGIIVNGFFRMNDETSDFDMTDTWTCFGDPSLLIRTDNPTPMIVSHNNVIVFGSENFIVNCSFNGGFATLSYNGQIIGSAIVSNGLTSIPTTGIAPGQVISIAIIGFNKITYTSEVTVIAATGSYLIVDTMESNSIDFGQSKNLNFSLKNLGVENSLNASALISCTNTNATLTNTNYNFGNIISNSSSAISNDMFTLQVANNLVDQYPVELNIELTDESNEIWNETKTIYVNAPKLLINNLTVIDIAGNNNGTLDPGENGIIRIEVENNGHANITNVIGTLTANNTGLIINNSTTAPYSITTDGNHLFEFSVTASPITIDGTTVQLVYGVTGGIENQYSNQKNFALVIGFVATYCDAGSNNTEDEYISNVVFSNINNQSERASSYTDFTAITTDVTRGQSYSISITNGEHFGGDQMGSWIDWNYDGDFTDSDEFFTIDYQNPIGLGTIIVPENARIGSTRMRIRLLYDGAILPCGNTNYGEVEDYTINILSQTLNTKSFDDSILKVYPNPNNGNFVLELVDNQKVTSNDSIEIYALSGQLLFKKTDISNYNQIAISISKGLYILKLKHAGVNSYKKIIIE